MRSHRSLPWHLVRFLALLVGAVVGLSATPAVWAQVDRAELEGLLFVFLILAAL